MPVTAKLSKAFYDRFGEQVVGELIDWFNQVDASYRGELRDLNELNFARFDAKLEQRVAELRADFEVRFAASDTRLERRIGELRTEVHDGDSALRESLERGLHRQSQWLLGMWITIIATAVALWTRG